MLARIKVIHEHKGKDSVLPKLLYLVTDIAELSMAENHL